MKMLAFYNNKGGVGKTTAAINVAYALSKKKKQVLVIDCDGQSNSSRFLVDAYNENCGIEQALVSSYISPNAALKASHYVNISVIVSTPKMNEILPIYEQKKSEGLISIDRIKKEFEMPWCSVKYDYIIADLPPAMNTLTEDILSICDYCFVPIELGTFAIQGIANVTQKIATVGTKFGGCFASKFDKKNPADFELLEILKENLGDKVLKTVIPFSRVIKNSISYRMTAAEYMRWTNAGKCFSLLADEITKICDKG